MSAVRREEPGYEDDFFAWTQHQAQLLRDRRFDRLDVEALAEEIESLGRRDRRELVSRCKTLVAHLLKWAAQGERRSGSWRATIHEQREQIEVILAESPSLRATVDAVLRAEWGHARRRAAAETGLPLETFPEAPCWRADDVLSDEFFPDGLEPDAT